MTRKHQRNTTNGTRGAVLAFQNREVAIPPFIVPFFEIDGFRDRWNAMTSCRMPDCWQDWELNEVAEIVKEQMQCERLEAEIQEEGETLTFPNGAVSQNPKFKMAMELKKMYLARIRAIGLNDIKQQAKTNGAVAARDLPAEGADLL
jgi:hypothetical protein